MVFTDELQAKLTGYLTGIAGCPEEGPACALVWINTERCNYRRDAASGRLTGESVDKVLLRLDQVEQLIKSSFVELIEAE
jgi:hypothetical protein